jgi:hypothetical protein
MPRPHNAPLRQGGIADVCKHLADMYRQPHLWAQLCAARARRLRHLMTNRQGRLDSPLGHLVKRQRQSKGDDVQ